MGIYPALLRYFKQIVKSARANGTAGPTEDHTDDFLGCLNIPVRVSRGQGLFPLGTLLVAMSCDPPKPLPSFLGWVGALCGRGGGRNRFLGCLVSRHP